MAKKAFTRRDVEQQWKRGQKAELGRKLAALRKKARGERATRKQRLKSAKKACDVRVSKAKSHAQRAFERARAAALKAQKLKTAARNAAREAAKKAARDKCDLDAAHIKADAAAKIAAAKKEETTERSYWKQYWHTEKIEKGHARARKKKVGRSAKERRQESDDKVRQNLTGTPHLLPLWEDVKRHMKGSARRSRSEQFAEYVETFSDAELSAHLERLSPVRETKFAAAEKAHWEEQQQKRGMVEEEVPF